MKHNYLLLGLCTLAVSLSAEPLQWVRVTNGSVTPQDAQVVSDSGDPSRYTDLIAEVAAEHNLDPQLIQAIVSVESAYRHDAISEKGAIGLMQLMPATAADYGKYALMEPRENLEAGITHLGGLLQRFNGRLDLALAGYNAGEGAVKRHGNTIPPYPETQLYVQKVLNHYKKLQESPSMDISLNNPVGIQSNRLPTDRVGSIGKLWDLFIGGTSKAISQ